MRLFVVVYKQQEAKEVMRQLTEVLDYLHSNGEGNGVALYVIANLTSTPAILQRLCTEI